MATWSELLGSEESADITMSLPCPVCGVRLIDHIDEAIEQRCVAVWRAHDPYYRHEEDVA